MKLHVLLTLPGSSDRYFKALITESCNMVGGKVKRHFVE